LPADDAIPQGEERRRIDIWLAVRREEQIQSQPVLAVYGGHLHARQDETGGGKVTPLAGIRTVGVEGEAAHQQRTDAGRATGRIVYQRCLAKCSPLAVDRREAVRSPMAEDDHGPEAGESEIVGRTRPIHTVSRIPGQGPPANHVRHGLECFERVDCRYPFGDADEHSAPRCARLCASGGEQRRESCAGVGGYWNAHQERSWNGVRSSERSPVTQPGR